jgi:lipopolysaccharide exporter
MREGYLKLAAVVIFGSMAIGGIMFIFASEIVRLMLGPQWMEAVPVIRTLAISGLIRGFVTIGGNVFYAAGAPQHNFRMNIVRLAVLTTTIVPFLKFWGLNGVALSVLLSSVVLLPIYLKLVEETMQVRPLDHLKWIRHSLKELKASGEPK